MAHHTYSKAEADIRYTELLEEYIKVSDSGEMTDAKEEAFFHDMEDFAWDISLVCKMAADKRLNEWYSKKEI